MYYILLEQAARIKDVEPLKYQALLAENQGNLLLAKQLWVRVLAVSRGDWEAVEAIGRIAMRQGGSFEPTITTELIIPASGGRSTKEFSLAHNQAEHEQNLTRYQQDFLEVINREYPLKELTKKQLEQLQQSLQLSFEEVLQIEQPIIDKKEAEYQKEQVRISQQQEVDRKQQEELHKQQEKEKQRQKEEVEYNQKLQQYEQLFTNATRQEYPLTLAKKNELEHLRYNLSLTNEDVAEIEARITAEIEAHHKKIQQYEQFLTQSIQYEYQLTDEICGELRRLQQVLEIGDEEVARIEEKVIQQKNINQLQANPELPHTSNQQLVQESNNKLILRQPIRTWLISIAVIVLSGFVGFPMYMNSRQGDNTITKPDSSVSKSITPQPTISPVTANPAPTVSPVSTDFDSLLDPVGEITDSSRLRELNRQVWNQIDPAWNERSAVKQDLVYLVGVAGDGAIIGYKAVN